MGWMATGFAKFLSLYSSNISFKITIWLIAASIAATAGTVTVQALVLRRYKRTIYKLRASTMQLKAERDIAKESLVQEKLRHNMALLKKKEEGYEKKRQVLFSGLKDSKKKSQILAKKLKSKLRVIDDLEIKQLLKNSKDLEESLGGGVKKVSKAKVEPKTQPVKREEKLPSHRE